MEIVREFSKSGFVNIIQFARLNKYEILPLRDAKRVTSSPKLILRHDVDTDLGLALKLAELENKLGIKATYFILLFNNFYNPLSPSNREIIAKIKLLGHEIGLHWDSRDYQKPNWEGWFKTNLKILSEIAGETIISASQHEPISTPKMNVDRLVVNETYSDKFREFIYVSDSSMNWRQYSPWELIAKNENIQFLAHPLWWMTKNSGRSEKVLESFARSSQNQKVFYNGILKQISFVLKNRSRLDKEFGFRESVHNEKHK